MCKLLPIVILIFSTSLSALPKQIKTFTEAYCMDCHDDETTKGDFSMEGLLPKIVAKNAFHWNDILDQFQTTGHTQRAIQLVACGSCRCSEVDVGRKVNQTVGIRIRIG